MERITPSSLSRTSFRRQLTLTFSIGVICLALISAVVTSWLGSKRTRTNMVQQGNQVTQNFARQSKLALLYGDGENAKDAAHGTLEFPDVRYVAIYDLDGSLILEKGIPLSARLENPHATTAELSYMVGETPSSWSFVAPVYTQANDELESELSTMEAKPELLGYVNVELSKDTLNKTVNSIIVSNITISLTLALGLLLLLRYITTRLTEPLNALSSIMCEAETGGSKARAEEKGPLEVIKMAHAFNSMMEALEERDRALRRQNDQLEQRVEERTRELAVARDEALLASKTKSAFLANMSHELRTPLNAIIGYSEILMEEAEDEQLQHLYEDLERIRGSGKHLLALISDILDLSKIEAGRMELEISEFSIDSLVRNVEVVAHPLAQKNANTLIIDCPDDIGIMAADETKLRQTLLNLLGNACKFTEHGQVSLHVTHKTHSGQDWINFEVRDTGIGMTQEQTSKLFQDFIQADASTTRKYGGTGLGLSISQRFCQMMGGEIRVQSQPEQGSSFAIHLPRKSHHQKADYNPREIRTRNDRRSTICSVLLVEDDAEVCTRIEKSLVTKGFACITAASGQEGLLTAKAAQPNLIVFDIGIADMDLGAFLGRLHSKPDLAGIPVLMLAFSADKCQGYVLNIQHVIRYRTGDDLNAMAQSYIKRRPAGRILIAEKAHDHRPTLPDVFTAAGWEVMTTAEAMAASEQADFPAPDLILFEPEIFATELIDYLPVLHRHRHLTTICVVLISTDEQAVDRARLFAEQVAEPLQKIVYDSDELITDLIQVITDHVRNPSAESAAQQEKSPNATAVSNAR